MNLNEDKSNFTKELVSEDFNILKKDDSKTSNQKESNIENKDSIVNKENKDINILNVIDNKKRENDRYDNIILKKNIKYGIDETGNPMDVDQYYRNINNKVINKKRLVAYIIKDENNENVLVDLNGNKIIKNKDGDYEFPFQLKLLIKEFDVKHPELRLTGERIYSSEESLKMGSKVPNQYSNGSNKIPCDNNKIKIINITKSDSKINPLGTKEKLPEEISLQFDSVETSDNTSLRITNSSNNLVNKIYKNNLRNKNDMNDIYYRRYGKLRDLAIKRKGRKKNSYEKSLINYSYNRSKNSIFNNKEIILRTNSILNINKSNDNIFSNSNNNIYTLNNLAQNFNQSKKIKNEYLNDINYFPQNKNNHSPIKKKSSAIYYKNHILNNRNFINNSFLNSETNIVNNNINSNQNNIYFRCSNLNNGMTLPTFITSPSLFIYKNKLNRVLSGFKNENIYSNKKIENYSDRVKNILIDKNKLNQLNNIIKENHKNAEYLNNKNFMKKEESFNKCIYKYNINDKESLIQKNYNLINKLKNIKILQKTRNRQILSSIKTNDLSENELKDSNEILSEKNYHEKEAINTNFDVNNLIPKIKKNRKKVNKNNKNYSVLTVEASNMVKNFLSKKNKIKNKRIMRMKSLLNKNDNDSHISSFFFSIRNKSFN